MADELSIRIGICTADQALGQALCRVLEGWAQVVCANLDLALWTSAAQAEPADCALLLLDLDEGDATFRLAARASVLILVEFSSCLKRSSIPLKSWNEALEAE